MAEHLQRHTFELWPWTVRLGGVAAMVPGVWIVLSGATDVWPLMLMGTLLLIARHQIVFDPSSRRVQRRIGLLLPLIRLGYGSVSQIVLEERVTGARETSQRDYHVMVVGDSIHSISVAKERGLARARAQAEQLARAAGVPLLDLATGAGTRPVATLDQSLRSRIREMGWQMQPLGPSGRLRANGARVELPSLPVIKQLLIPVGIPLLFFIVFGALAVVAGLGVNHGGHDPIFIAITSGLTALCFLILIATIVLYRDRLLRVHAVEIDGAGLVIHATRFGRPRQQRFELDEIESIGIGGRAKLSGYARDTAQTVVIASDRQIATIGCRLTSAERSWLAGFLTQMIAKS